MTDAKKALLNTMIQLFKPLVGSKLLTIISDRGKGFSDHRRISKALDGVEFYFADPHSPWQRGTNENTNGFLREYMPKRICFDAFTQEQIDEFILKLNLRARKCLNWKTPFEVFFDTALHMT